jgi:hypothetical protein
MAPPLPPPAAFSKGIGSIGKGGLVSMVRKMSQLPYWMAERCEQMLGNATLMEVRPAATRGREGRARALTSRGGA